MTHEEFVAFIKPFAVAGEALGDHVLVNYPEHPEAH